MKKKTEPKTVSIEIANRAREEAQLVGYSRGYNAGIFDCAMASIGFALLFTAASLFFRGK